MTKIVSLFLLASALCRAETEWLDRVAPLLSRSEKKTYVSLNQAEQRAFEEKFWANKSISAEDYFQRVAYIDATFGSGKAGSGANTDQGSVYLSLGPPTKISRLPSSRIFVPLEIWYYDTVPGLLNTELRLIFYQKNSIGFPKLYSPTTDTIRVLLLPEAATIEAFGPNDSLTESDIRQILIVPPAEDEVISAAVNVATGVKYTGNDEILGKITSPRLMLSMPLTLPPGTEVTSRLVTTRPKLEEWQSSSEYGGSQVDLRFETAAARELNLEVLVGATPIYRNRIRLNFEQAQPVTYMHRLDLLPGEYRLLFTVDGQPAPYALEVNNAAAMSAIIRADLSAAGGRQTPFQLDGRQVDPNPNGRFVIVSLPAAEPVTWRIRKGLETVWKSISKPARLAVAELPANLSPGNYTVEAATASESRAAELVIVGTPAPVSAATLVSYNANLSPALRLAFIGHQWLLRGNLKEAQQSLAASLEKGATEDAQVELARADALLGKLDAARDRARGVLNRNPKSFDALSVLAYVETQLQDYGVAAELYQRALAIQDSPTLRAALAETRRRENGK